MERYMDLENEHLRAEPLPPFEVGDTVDVKVKIKEGDKERIQVFNGTVIARRGSGLSETFTVRRIVQGEGVERIFPNNSPKVVDLVVKAKAVVHRAKLYYLRGRTGKGTRLKERLGARPQKGPGS
jgi:large subunit ribosomal protein L19